MWGNSVVIHGVLKKKTTKLNFQWVQYEENKSTKTILKTNHKKIMSGNTVVIHNVLKKKTTKLNSQAAQH